MDSNKLFLITMQACEMFFNDMYSGALKNNDVKHMEKVNIMLETLEIIEKVFYEVLRLKGEQDDG